MKSSTRNTLLVVVPIVLAVVLSPYLWDQFEIFTTRASAAAPPAAERPIAVSAAVARRGAMDIVITALGTVTARETVTVRSRVDGELIRIHFIEGQRVEAGDLLAEIDPRPYQIALDQANGQLRKDQALLENSRLDLVRYRDLLAQDSIAAQQVDAQAALVHQYEGTVMTDRAEVDDAKLQLTYARITAPISGRLGLRQIDVGNIIHASDTTGLVVITSTQPVTALFTIPSEKLPAIRERMQAGAGLTVDAFDRSGANRLAVGKLLSLDNQIDTATATLKLKAEFANEDEKLFPNQFVNIGLHVETREGVTLIPSAAVQRGQNGAFVYVVGADQAVQLRTVTLGPAADDAIVIETGLAPGDRVVTDGVDKLHDGSRVVPAAVASIGTDITEQHASPATPAAESPDLR